MKISFRNSRIPSDSVEVKKVYYKNLDEIVIYPLSPENLKHKISQIGTALDCEDSIKARKLLSEVKTTLDEKEKSLIRNHNYNHVFLDTIIKIQEGRCFILVNKNQSFLRR